MYGTELGTFICANGKERTLLLVSMHAVILASGSLLTNDEALQQSRAMSTINFFRPDQLAGMKVHKRCRDCKLAFWKTCTLPKRHIPEVDESALLNVATG